MEESKTKKSFAYVKIVNIFMTNGDTRVSYNETLEKHICVVREGIFDALGRTEAGANWQKEDRIPKTTTPTRGIAGPILVALTHCSLLRPYFL